MTDQRLLLSVSYFKLVSEKYSDYYCYYTVLTIVEGQQAQNIFTTLHFGCNFHNFKKNLLATTSYATWFIKNMAFYFVFLITCLSNLNVYVVKPTRLDVVMRFPKHCKRTCYNTIMLLQHCENTYYTNKHLTSVNCVGHQKSLKQPLHNNNMLHLLRSHTGHNVAVACSTETLLSIASFCPFWWGLQLY